MRQEIPEDQQVWLEYRGNRVATVTIMGPVTKRIYHFGKASPVSPVHVDDADALQERYEDHKPVFFPASKQKIAVTKKAWAEAEKAKAEKVERLVAGKSIPKGGSKTAKNSADADDEDKSKDNVGKGKSDSDAKKGDAQA